MGSVRDTLEKVKIEAGEKRNERLADIDTKVIVGTATCGVSAGATGVVEALEDEIRIRGIQRAVVTETGCSGRCELEPLVQVLRHGEPPVLYYHITPEKARRIVQQHIQNNEVISEWALT